MADVVELEARLDYRFKDIGLLKEAMTHPSAVQDKTTMRHNQRLEFLGDAVLQLVLTRELFGKFSNMGEGPLTKARAQLVNRWTLSTRSRALGLGRFLVLSKGEEMNEGRDRDSILADAFEALVGAIFFDGGYREAERIILGLYREMLEKIEMLPNQHNPKGELQELLQADFNEAPGYELVSISGPDHSREFECCVLHKGRELGRGRGPSKKVAEARAAAEALTLIKGRKSAQVK